MADEYGACDAPDLATATYLDGSCRCLVCARCGHHTGNSTQGHFLSFCKVTRTMRSPHFCCVSDCELEAPEGKPK